VFKKVSILIKEAKEQTQKKGTLSAKSYERAKRIKIGMLPVLLRRIPELVWDAPAGRDRRELRAPTGACSFHPSSPL
jgi:hypothetical protein